MNERETIPSIVEEMRRWARAEGNKATWEWSDTKRSGWTEAAMRAHLELAADKWKEFCNRIDLAYKRTNAAGPFNADGVIDVDRIRKVIAKITDKLKDELFGPKQGVTLVFDDWSTELMIAIGDYPKPGQTTCRKELRNDV